MVKQKEQAVSIASGGSIRVEGLTANGMRDPEICRRERPDLGWRLSAEGTGRTGVRQTAYQIRAAVRTGAAEPNLWDSGRIDSDASVSVRYDGPMPAAGGTVRWRVRVWDERNEPSAWSGEARFTAGYEEGEFGADWIGYGMRAGGSPLSIRSHLWTYLIGAGGSAARLPLSIRIPGDRVVAQALIGIRAPSVTVNGAAVAEPMRFGYPFLFDVKEELRPGDNTIVADWNGGEMPAAGEIARIRIVFREGDSLEMAGLSAGVLPPGIAVSEGGWAADDRLPFVAFNAAERPAAYLRRSFVLDEQPVRAILRAAALGLYEAWVNGERVGPEALSPGWTDYNRRVPYLAHDVTGLLRQGENVLAVLLGDGWYAGHVGDAGPGQYGDLPYFCARLDLETASGRTVAVVTDGSWKAAHGAVRYSDLIMGEVYDAGLHPDGWTRPGYDEDGWHKPDVKEDGGPALEPLAGPPVVRAGERLPVLLGRAANGAFLYDMGQNMTGWARIRMTAPPGACVRIRYAEALDADGSLYTANLRTARQEDCYYARGGCAEEYEPHFTLHGFRYVEIAGLDAPPSEVAGIVVHSGLRETGTLRTSDARVNRLVSNIRWSQRGNFISVPTDCPQRNERLGWAGDAQVFAATAAYNADIRGFMGKWMTDMADAQLPSGAYSDVAPRLKWAGAGTAAWGDAGIIVPWTVYLMYGDTSIIERHYEGMKRWIDYCVLNSKGFIRPDSGYGDWLSPDEETPRDLIGTAYFAYSAGLLARMAEAVGRSEDASALRRLRARIAEAFAAAFADGCGRIKGDTQTAYVLALHLELLPEGLRQAAADRLIELIRGREWHLATGFLGVGFLLPLLSGLGRDDTAYRLLLQDTYPSWLFSIAHGATTIWERWDGWTPDNGFQDPSMNSFNHYSLGSVGEWLYRFAAGLEADPAHPGFKHFFVRPRPGSGLSYCFASLDTGYGTASSGWERDEAGRLTVKAVVPPNTEATVLLPWGRLVRVGSGTYAFTQDDMPAAGE